MADDEKELKDQRVVTMMSPSELEAIDNWMFANRIRSRGDAIRRLCQIGMLTDQQQQRSTVVLSSAEHLSKDEKESLQPVRIQSGPQGAAINKLLAIYAEFESAVIVDSMLSLIEISTLKSSKSTADAMSDAQSLKDELESVDITTVEGRDRVLKLSRRLRPTPNNTPND